MADHYKFADLDDTSLLKMKEFEEKHGTTLVALQSRYPLAELKSKEVKDLKNLEKELQVTLVAYRKE